MIKPLLVAVLMMATTLSAQTIRRPPCDFSCEMGWTPPTFRRVIPLPPPAPTTDPLVDYLLPRGVGVTQVLHEEHFTTRDFMDEVADYGINIVQVWIEGDPFDGAGEWGTPPWNMGTPNRDPYYEDMDYVWRHPDIDVIVVRFTSTAWTTDDNVWAEYPIGRITRKLLRRYGEQDKDIIFVNWEGDNQWRTTQHETAEDNAGWCGWWAKGCQDEYTLAECSRWLSMARMRYVAGRTGARQEAVERVRAEFPDAVMRVYNALVVNNFDEAEEYYGMNLIKSVVPYLERSPDFLGVSYWPHNEKTASEVLDYIRHETGYPAHRVFIAEVGEKEDRPGKQYDRIMSVVPDAFDAGYAMALVWMWRQTWQVYRPNGWPKNFGMWEWADGGGFTGETNSGFDAIMELNGGGEDE